MGERDTDDVDADPVVEGVGHDVHEHQHHVLHRRHLANNLHGQGVGFGVRVWGSGLGPTT